MLDFITDVCYNEGMGLKSLIFMRRELISLKINTSSVLKITGSAGAIALGGLGIVSIGYLCLQGITAPACEAHLREQIGVIKRRMAAEREHAEKRSERAGYQAGYKIGEREGHNTGFGAGKAVGYDQGFLAALNQETYLGDSAEILKKLGITPEEHAIHLQEAREKRFEDEWALLEKIFGGRRDEPLLKGAKVPPPEPLSADEIVGEQATTVAESNDDALCLAAQGLPKSGATDDVDAAKQPA